MAKRAKEGATRGGERRNNAAYGYGVSLGAFTIALGAAAAAALAIEEAGGESCVGAMPMGTAAVPAVGSTAGTPSVATNATVRQVQCGIRESAGDGFRRESVNFQS